MFVGTQQRVTVNNTHYNVAMVFYNKILQKRIPRRADEMT